jgi:hypothetical protein
MGVRAAMVHADWLALNSMWVAPTHALDEVFIEQDISWGLWPSQSPDLNPCYFYL